MTENRRGVVRWVTKHRHTGLYFVRGFSWAQDRWVRNPADATLHKRRSDWSPAKDERRVKVLVTATEASR